MPSFLVDLVKLYAASVEQFGTVDPTLPDQPATIIAKPKELIEILIGNLEGKYPARSHFTVHASDITRDSFCPRQTALLDITGKCKKPQWQETAQTATYDVGNAISDLVREKWLIGHAVGDWICRSCGHKVLFTKQPPECFACGGTSLRYDEVRFEDPIFGFSGGIDVLVDTGSPLLEVVEIKIITPVDFEKLQGPLAEHRLRTNLYLNLIKNSQHPDKDRINTETGKVLYVSRAWGKKHLQYGKILPFKEFVVESNHSDLIPFLKKALDVKKWRDHKIMPAGVCDTSYCQTAKTCSVIKECWSGKFPVMSS